MDRIKHALGIILAIIATSCQTHDKQNESYYLLSVQYYQEAVYASWLGQIVGNTYGLGYEFKFIDEPGPDLFPYGYSFTINDLVKYNGAYSDDDTDIEYMYLTQMEKHGTEPTYFHLAEAWKYHVKERVWFANRMAVTLMHAGHYPPVTGDKNYNCEWFQIDPQLVNEIWAITAPGMVNYAVDKSEFAARITSDDFGLEPTLHYAAMYSAAFFEKDVNKLIEIGKQYIPENGKFYKVIELCESLFQQYPENWQQARKKVVDSLYVYEDYNSHSWPVVDANLNGALGILALLYGQGNFQKTLDYSCAFGMDADNQAATMCGLLGIVNGLDGIPKELLYPVDTLKWEKPFNDSYKMITREGLSDAKITVLAERTAEQGKKIILEKGGKLIENEGIAYFKIPIKSVFEAPFELNSLPEFHVIVNQPFSYPVYTGCAAELTLSGDVPDGIHIEAKNLCGIPSEAGNFEFELSAYADNQLKSIKIQMHVHSENLAPKATAVLFNSKAIDKNVELIRDGNTTKTYYSKKNHNKQAVDFYGYLWDEAQGISMLQFNLGKPHEFSGWFTSFDVEYVKDNRWVKVDDFKIYPEMNLDNNQWLKPTFVDYSISINPVKTKAIRIIGKSGGIEKDAANAHLGIDYYTSISELKVFHN